MTSEKEKDETFGGILCFYRERAVSRHSGRTLSQERLASEVGKKTGLYTSISRNLVSNWENDKSYLHPQKDRHILVAIIAVLHENGGIKSLQDANQLLESGKYAGLTHEEANKIKFPEIPVATLKSNTEPSPSPIPSINSQKAQDNSIDEDGIEKENLSESYDPTSTLPNKALRETQHRLIGVLRDPRYFSMDNLHVFWQDFIEPTVDWNVILRSGRSQAELAGDLVARVTRNNNLDHLAASIDKLLKAPNSFDLNVDKDFIKIPAGLFWMGSLTDDLLAESAEKPQREFPIPYTFWMACHPVTNRQFLIFLKQTNNESDLPVIPSQNLNHPVVNVSWYSALEYCKWLTQMYRQKLEQGYVFRLPSEAEWEMAARGHLPSKRKYPWGNHWSTLELSLCNSVEDGLNSTTPVGAYSPHGDSFYKVADMAGNVQEWTRSAWGESYEIPDFGYPYRLDKRESLELPDSFLRVARGGSFSDDKNKVTCAYRHRHPPIYKAENLGFRVAISPMNQNPGPKKLNQLKIDPMINNLAQSLLKKQQKQQ